MKVTRRALAGVAAAMATAARAPFNQYRNAIPPGMPPGGYPMTEQQAPQADPNWARDRRRELLENKKHLERLARGELTAEDLIDFNADPRRREFDATAHAINGLRSVSQAHKVRMAEELSQQRYIAYRIKSAKDHLRRIAQELLGLG